MMATYWKSFVRGLFQKHKDLRIESPVTVYCWFCEKKTVVPCGNQNCWDCPHCEQYNGFNEDGDYNKPIPAQYMEMLNHPVTLKAAPPTAASRSETQVYLCDTCNRNQQLKIKQLANFRPTNEETYDQEVVCFKEQLESTYRLCHKCEFTVQSVIYNQDSQLQHLLYNQPLINDSHSDINQTPSQIFKLGSLCFASVLGYSSIMTNLSNKYITGCELIVTMLDGRRIYLPWYVQTMRVVSILCSLLFCIVTAAKLFTDTRGSEVKATHLSLLADTLSHGYEYKTGLIWMGLFVGNFAIFIADKQGLILADGFCSFTWLCILALNAGYTEEYIQLVQRYWFQCLSAGVSTVLSVWCAYYPRYIKGSPVRIRKLVPRRDTSFSSTALNRSGCSSLSDTSYDESYIKKTKTPQTSCSETKLRKTRSQTPFLDKLETMSLGTPSIRSKTESVFSWDHIADIQPTSSTEPASEQDPGNKRVLIRPARFKPNRRPLGPSSCRSPLTSYPAQSSIDDDQWSFMTVRTQAESDSDDSSESTSSSLSSSVPCPVDSTVSIKSAHLKGRKRRKTNIFMITLGVSIGVNLTLAVCFLVHYKGWL